MNSIDYIVKKLGSSQETLNYLQQQAQYHKNQYEDILRQIDLISKELSAKCVIQE